MKALHFGSGNIGLGFVGKILSESGFSIIFSDINKNIVEAINNNKEYFVQVVGNSRNIVEDTKSNIVNVKNVSAINFNDSKITDVISSVDLITTASGPGSLDKIALILAEGIKLKIRKKSISPLNIIACENKIKSSSFLQREVYKKLSFKYHDYMEEYIGFVDCSIDTIVPLINQKNKNFLFLTVENFKEWIVNAAQFKGVVPKIKNMKLSNNLDAFIERKLFTLNTGHAIAAYLGLIKNYQTIREAILDEKIRIIVRSAMKESGDVLIKIHNFDRTSHSEYINKIFCRFENPFLSDSLERIARNPWQKLGKEERLVKPFLRSIKHQLPCSNLATGIAAAFYYNNINDIESVKIASFLKKYGIKKSLIEVCNLSGYNQELERIILKYNSMHHMIK